MLLPLVGCLTSWVVKFIYHTNVDIYGIDIKQIKKSLHEKRVAAETKKLDKHNSFV